MNFPKPLLAQLDKLPVSGETQNSLFGPQNRDMVIIVSSIVGATLVAALFLWLAHKRQQKLLSPPPPSLLTGEKQRIFTLKHRDEPEIEYPRNPTLAERGGLPPIKEKRNSPS